MKDILNRLTKQRYNVALIKSVFKSTNNGRMDKSILHIVENWSYVLFFTFLIKWLLRIYISYENAEVSISAFLTGNWWIIIIWFFVYALFLDTLLGIGYHDSLLKTRSNKYVKTLIFIIIYLIGDLVSIPYFMNIIYDNALVGLIGVGCCVLILISYIIIFMCVLDFILYSTDNSDDSSINSGTHFDFV